jgi:creatinine amidohydrolase
VTVVRWEELTREEVARVAPQAVAVLPVAAIEQHGPHLATVTDTAIVGALLDRALPQCQAEVLRAPTLCYGASDHHLPFGGTLSLTTATLGAVLADLLRSLALAGCRRILLLNGHGGNDAACRIAATEAARAHGVTVAATSYWQLADPPEGLNAPGHAGEFETSIALALDPALVRAELARPSPAAPPSRAPGLHVEGPELWARIDGVTDDPRRATAELGEALLTRYAAAVAAAVDHLAKGDR